MSNSLSTVNQQETQLIEDLRNNPKLFDLFSEVIEVYQGDPKRFEDLNAIEAFLMQKVKSIGNNALEHWARSMEKEVCMTEQASKGVRKHSKKNSTSLPC